MYSQQNIEALFELIGSYPGQSFQRGDHYDVITTSGSIWPNQLINPRFTGGTDQFLRDLKRQVKEEKLPGLIMCAPNTDQETLTALETREYRKSVWTAMTYDMSEVKQAHTPSELSVIEVKEEQEMQQWLSLAESELMGEHLLNEDIFQRLRQEESCTFFLGSIQEKVVATSFLFQTDKVGGIYLVATDSDHRKKGIGKTMTGLCMKKAAESGCLKIDLQATALGKSVYASLGFKEQGEIRVFSILTG